MRQARWLADDAGYRHLHLDDCWAAKERNATGYPYPEHDHFPNGMKPVIDYVHSKGKDGDNLVFGLYTCGGMETCVGGRVGSEDYWEQDAAAYAEWGVDWVRVPRLRFQSLLSGHHAVHALPGPREIESRVHNIIMGCRRRSRWTGATPRRRTQRMPTQRWARHSTNRVATLHSTCGTAGDRAPANQPIRLTLTFCYSDSSLDLIHRVLLLSTLIILCCAALWAALCCAALCRAALWAVGVMVLTLRHAVSGARRTRGSGATAAPSPGERPATTPAPGGLPKESFLRFRRSQRSTPESPGVGTIWSEIAALDHDVT
jgi:hypothetical protein